mgnify:CR=1 FL=1
MRRLLLPLAFAIPALMGTGAQASEELAWSYTPWVTQDLLAQAEADKAVYEAEEDDNDWRLYLDLYGFLPIDANGSTTLDGNTNNIIWDLGDVLDNVSSVLTLRAGVEFDRWGFQARNCNGVHPYEFSTILCDGVCLYSRRLLGLDTIFCINSGCSRCISNSI